MAGRYVVLVGTNISCCKCEVDSLGFSALFGIIFGRNSAVLPNRCTWVSPSAPAQRRISLLLLICILLNIFGESSHMRSALFALAIFGISPFTLRRNYDSHHFYYFCRLNKESTRMLSISDFGYAAKLHQTQCLRVSRIKTRNFSFQACEPNSSIRFLSF